MFEWLGKKKIRTVRCQSGVWGFSGRQKSHTYTLNVCLESRRLVSTFDRKVAQRRLLGTWDEDRPRRSRTTRLDILTSESKIKIRHDCFYNVPLKFGTDFS